MLIGCKPLSSLSQYILSISTGTTHDLLTFHLKTFLTLPEPNQQVFFYIYYLDTDSPIFESLDTKITSLEIDDCIRKLKNHKCAGKDRLINENFSEFSDIILPILVDFFKQNIRLRLFPASWSKKEKPTILVTTDH